MRTAPIAALAALVAGSAASAWAGPQSATPPAFTQHFAQSQPPAAPPSPAARTAERQATAPPKPPTPTDPIVARYSPVYEGCMRKAASTLDMIDCAGHENDRWDARLNRAYQARMASFNDRQRGALKRAQKAWAAFRDADCAAYEDDDWGTISKIDASQCVLRRTVERTVELEAFPADHGPG
jgi:uncharacterized protein YecT (DUF1311 family)